MTNKPLLGWRDRICRDVCESCESECGAKKCSTLQIFAREMDTAIAAAVEAEKQSVIAYLHRESGPPSMRAERAYEAKNIEQNKHRETKP